MLPEEGRPRYLAGNSVATKDKTGNGLCLNSRLHAVAQFDHLGAGGAAESGPDSGGDLVRRGEERTIGNVSITSIVICAANSVERADAELACPR